MEIRQIGRGHFDCLVDYYGGVRWRFKEKHSDKPRGHSKRPTKVMDNWRKSESEINSIQSSGVCW